MPVPTAAIRKPPWPVFLIVVSEARMNTLEKVSTSHISVSGTAISHIPMPFEQSQ